MLVSESLCLLEHISGISPSTPQSPVASFSTDYVAHPVLQRPSSTWCDQFPDAVPNKPNRASFGVSIPQIPTLLAPGLLAHVDFQSLELSGANILTGEHFIPLKTLKDSRPGCNDL